MHRWILASYWTMHYAPLTLTPCIPAFNCKCTALYTMSMHLKDIHTLRASRLPIVSASPSSALWTLQVLQGIHKKTIANWMLLEPKNLMRRGQILPCTWLGSPWSHLVLVREAAKYHLADFFDQGGTPTPLKIWAFGPKIPVFFGISHLQNWGVQPP